MIKRQQRMQRIADVAQEYLAALTAANWLRATQDAEPNFGQKDGWDAKAGSATCASNRGRRLRCFRANEPGSVPDCQPFGSPVA